MGEEDFDALILGTRTLPSAIPIQSKVAVWICPIDIRRVEHFTFKV